MQLGVVHDLGEGVEGHGVDEVVVVNDGAWCKTLNVRKRDIYKDESTVRLTIFELSCLGLGINLSHSSMVTESSPVLGQRLGDCNPDTTRSAMRRETERVIRAPSTGDLVQNDVASK